ncbi:MAG: Rpn family recombination-promoting nuclease/putative transposase [Leptonema sp. (in: Bacteria)]|nr:Rpn family recombination-promoting nuclease/putative transposase [Leptonema sp. (in: bacteria)]
MKIKTQKNYRSFYRFYFIMAKTIGKSQPKYIDLFTPEHIEIFKDYIPQFQYFLEDLSLIDEKKLKGDLQLQATLFLFKNISSKDLPNKLYEFVKIIEEIDEPESKVIDLFQKFLIYIIGGSKQEYRAEIFKSLNDTSNRVRKTMGTIYDSILEEGIEKGLKKGREEGILVGQHQAKIESAKNLFKNGVSIEIIASSTGLSKEELKKHGVK